MALWRKCAWHPARAFEFQQLLARFISDFLAVSGFTSFCKHHSQLRHPLSAGKCPPCTCDHHLVPVCGPLQASTSSTCLSTVLSCLSCSCGRLATTCSCLTVYLFLLLFLYLWFPFIPLILQERSAHFKHKYVPFLGVVTREGKAYVLSTNI